MKSSKLAQLLSTFDPGQWRQFEDFVASPFFNKSEELIRLTAYLKGFAPDITSSEVTAEQACKAVAPGKPYDARQMGYWMNYLHKLGEQFVSIRRYQLNTPRQYCDVLNEFSERKLDKHYLFLYRKAEGDVERALADTESLRFRYELAETASKHFIRQRVRSFDSGLQHAADALDQLYFLQKLKYSCEMLNRQAIISADYSLSFIEEVCQFLERQPERLPLADIYLHVYRSLAGDSEAHFSRLIELILQYSEKIQPLERREVYLYAINFCARKIRQGREEYVPIVLGLYMQGITDESLFEGGYLSHWTYTNVVKLALRQKDYKWAEQFIREYSRKLAPHSREDALHFNLAELFYQKEQYGEVLSHLSQLNFTDMFYHMGSRTVLAKTYYESDEIESLLSLMASFSGFLRRNKKISPALKKTYLNFCNLLIQLLHDNPRKREKVKAQIQHTQPLAERAWLMKVWEERGRAR
ncbi:MAG: hypothetical protein H6564_14225 [Lewinellaceae bacterium]|nr:hypothetical protein [Lewinellaceae bacterium]